jgi:hypothetical protein
MCNLYSTICRSVWAAVIFIGVMMVPVAARPNSMIGSQGTLVVLIPTNRGLVIAADSRSTTLGVRCDGNSKISFPRQPSLSVVAATGTSTWISARVPLWPHDPCGDIAKNGITFLDSKKIAVEYLEQNNKPVRDIDWQDFARHVTAEILRVADSNPEYVRTFAGKTMFLIVFGAYDPDEKISYVRAVQFNLTQTLAIEAKLVTDAKFDLSSGPDYPHFGDTLNFTENVMLGQGKEFLPVSLSELHAKASIAEVSNDLAADLAVNLIEAAKKTAASVPSLNSIGGPVDAYLLSSGGATKLK